MVCDFLLRWPNLDTLTGVRRATLERFFREHNSQRQETIEKRLAAIKEAVPLTTDKAVINSSVMMVKALAAQMKTTLAAVKEFNQQIEELCQSHEDFELFASLPGAGKVYASRLLTAMGANRERWASADELLCFSGVAPVVERVTSARSSSGRRSSSTRARASGTRSGRRHFTCHKKRRARVIKRRCAHSPTSGSGSSFVVGRRGQSMMRRDTWKCCGRKARHWSQRRLELKNTLDTNASDSLLDGGLTVKRPTLRRRCLTNCKAYLT